MRMPVLYYIFLDETSFTLENLVKGEFQLAYRL